MEENHKEWKSFEDQLEILRSRGLEISDNDAAVRYLDRIGYYGLSGYWYPFRKLDADSKNSFRLNEFMEGSRFEDAVKLYVFDKKLRLLALDAIERIELAVRVDIAHLLGKKDIFAHENPECLHGNFAKRSIKEGREGEGFTEHQLWLVKHRELVKRSKNIPFVKHYLAKYQKLPIWVAIELWDFGCVSRLYAGMMHNDKEAISKKYGLENSKVFSGWLKSLNYIRNVSAHHGRLWNNNILELSRQDRSHDFLKNVEHNRPFYYFCIMAILLSEICPNSSWASRFVQLCCDFPEPSNKAVSLTDFGVVDGWEQAFIELSREGMNIK